MTPALTYQLAAASLFLVVLCLSALPFMHADQRRVRLRGRIAQYASPYARATSDLSPEKLRSATAATGRSTFLKLITSLIAFDPERQERYLLAWWIVLPAAFVPARGLVMLAETLFGSSAAMALPIVWILIVRRFYRWCDQRRLRALYEQFPDALAMLVRAVRVGIPVTEGIRNIAAECPKPTCEEFAVVIDKLALGVTMEDALHELAARNPVPEYRFFATALALQSETGGAVSETLERLAEVIRKRVALREHASALASEAKTSIAILAALPVFTGLALAFLNPDYISTLFIDPEGRRVLTMAVVSLTFGVVTMRTVVRRSLS